MRSSTVGTPTVGCCGSSDVLVEEIAKCLLNRVNTSSQQADGEDVDPEGTDHKLDDFEDTIFVFSPEENSTYQGVAVKQLSFTASDLIQSGDGSKLTVSCLDRQ